MVKNIQVLSNPIVSQTEGNIVSSMGNEKVMLSVENGKYYNLGEVGGLIWDLIESPVTFEKVVRELRSQYEVSQSECEEQVNQFLQMLLEEGLIKVHG
ncbi:lasso peptide biosynthesis PqqD family chaperone [Halobacillus sp. A1]|uniref:lasso peptide biosynthesis PqqD family chaperone n=1 Tax=Halobacillus sp. A1 TaxID=2880262 RepID=UPI0020A629C1|nr:lasso peptide biosynthesis PqqD family chaperone [Halobacillus sp. A1]MCP3030070.1 lasso peptide biosynthesis PqqD family chaperone [Halobacillus sp. A1]